MDDVLSRYIQKVFSSWTVLRIAEQQRSGGMDTPEKIRNLVTYIMGQLARQMRPDDIAECLDEYLSRVLNIVCEDDSQFDVADLIHEAYSLHLDGKVDRIIELTAKVPPGCDLTSCSLQVACDESEPSSPSEGDDDDGDDDDSNDLDDDPHPL
ncbi:unnamed protein product [Hydatigera taeniaeformis]|uniref:Pre-rRNA-processing protein TSR2 homolog n=1 Tax=Hydatigena taeniaeformis TaxID=6205 RepID=A0A0R3X1C6_HYDTA|nr:unnamed protein product [Hydatigera taeniaeformis]